MKKLIITRHGQTHGYALSSMGEKQMISLGVKLSGKFKGDSIITLSSIAHRAMNSAKLVSQELGCKFISTSDLGDERGTQAINALVLRLLEIYDDMEYVVLITHLGTLDDFPKFYYREKFGRISPPYNPKQGEAVVIDITKQSLIVV